MKRGINYLRCRPLLFQFDFCVFSLLRVGEGGKRGGGTSSCDVCLPVFFAGVWTHMITHLSPAIMLILECPRACTCACTTTCVCDIMFAWISGRVEVDGRAGRLGARERSAHYRSGFQSECNLPPLPLPPPPPPPSSLCSCSEVEIDDLCVLKIFSRRSSMDKRKKEDKQVRERREGAKSAKTTEKESE